jgi:hypothetical protein
VGNSEQLADNEVELIESRHMPVAWRDAYVPNTMRLFYCNEDLDAYNKNCHPRRVSLHSHGYSGRFSTAAERNERSSKLHRLTLAETDGVPYTIPLAVSYPYMITGNIDVMDGLVNAAIGTLRCVEQLRSIDAHDDDDDDYQAPGTSRDCGKNNMVQQNKIILWFEFAQSSIGQRTESSVGRTF